MVMRCSWPVQIPPRLLVLAGAGVTVSAVNNYCQVSPSDQNRSWFLSAFNPTAVVMRLAPPAQTETGVSNGAGSTAPWARRDVTHQLEYKWRFGEGHTPSPEVIASLSEEAKASLRNTGAVVVSGGVRDGRFAISYCAGSARILIVIFLRAK